MFRSSANQKTIATPDAATLSTASFNAGMIKRIEAAVTLPPEVSKLYVEYERLAATPGGNKQRRADLLEELAKNGVVINDPQLQRMYATRALNGLISGSQHHLELHMKETIEPEVMQTLIDQARPGVTVDIRFRGRIEGESRRMLEEARLGAPDLPLDLVEYRGKIPMPHLDVVIADDRRALVGTNYLWANHLETIQPTGRSFEHGVVYGPEAIADLRRQLYPELSKMRPIRA